eukprot:510564_1
MSTYGQTPLYYKTNYYQNICDVCHHIIQQGIITSNQHVCRYCGDIVCSSPECSAYHEYNGLTLRACTTCHKRHQLEQHNELLSQYMVCSVESLITGYYRRHSRSHLPIDIAHLLYVWIGTICNEQWMDSYHHSIGKTIISQSQQCVEAVNETNDDTFYSAFGTNIIGKGMIKTWDFKIGSIGSKMSKSHLVIGIVSVNELSQYEAQCALKEDETFIGYGLDLKDGGLKNKRVGYKQKLFGNEFGIDGVSADDIITMTLDLSSDRKSGELSYQIIRKYNETVSKVAFHPNVDDRWILAVKLSKNEKLFLMEYLSEWVFVHTNSEKDA